MTKKSLLIVLPLALILSVAFLLPGFNLPAHSADKVITLKVANFFPPPSFQSKVLEEFCRDLEKRTGGKVKVDYYAGGSLLKAPTMFDGVVNGIADIASRQDLAERSLVIRLPPIPPSMKKPERIL